MAKFELKPMVVNGLGQANSSSAKTGMHVNDMGEITIYETPYRLDQDGTVDPGGFEARAGRKGALVPLTVAELADYMKKRAEAVQPGTDADAASRTPFWEWLLLTSLLGTLADNALGLPTAASLIAALVHAVGAGARGVIATVWLCQGAAFTWAIIKLRQSDWWQGLRQDMINVILPSLGQAKVTRKWLAIQIAGMTASALFALAVGTTATMAPGMLLLTTLATVPFWVSIQTLIPRLFSDFGRSFGAIVCGIAATLAVTALFSNDDSMSRLLTNDNTSGLLAEFTNWQVLGFFLVPASFCSVLLDNWAARRIFAVSVSEDAPPIIKFPPWVGLPIKPESARFEGAAPFLILSYDSEGDYFTVVSPRKRVRLNDAEYRGWNFAAARQIHGTSKFRDGRQFEIEFEIQWPGPSELAQRLMGERIAPQVIDLIEDGVLSPQSGIMKRLIKNIPTFLEEPLNDLDMLLKQTSMEYDRLESDLTNMSILASINAGNYEDLLKNWGTSLASMIYVLAQARERANKISSTLTVQEIARRFDEDFGQAVMKEITQRFEGRYNRKAKQQAMIFLSLIQDGISGTFGSLFKLGVQGDRLNELREKDNDLESKAQQLISGLHQKFQLEQERLAQLGTSRAERTSERAHEIHLALINTLSNLALNQPRAARNLADSLMSVINRPSAPIIDLSATATSPVNGESEQVGKSAAPQPSGNPPAPNHTASKGLFAPATKPKNHRGEMRRED